MTPRVCSSSFKKTELVCIDGPIGAGKTELCRLLMQKFKQTNLNIRLVPEDVKTWMNYHGENLLHDN